MNEGTLDFDPEGTDLARSASLQDLSQQKPDIPGYDLDRLLGEGSFGEVWGGVQRSTGQKVAVKILHRTDFGAVAYLEREVSRLAGVSEHPHLLTLIDANLSHVPAFLVTPWLAGSLESFNPKAMTIPRVLGWMREVAQALAFLHNRGILHCDLKPSNLLFDQQDRVRIVDFGQAHWLGQQGSSLGTLWYMPAEQVPVAGRVSHPEPAWDIYAYGATFYSLLGGQKPRQSEQHDQAIQSRAQPLEQLEEYRRRLRQSPLESLRRLNPAVDRDLCAIVEKCLSLEAEQRYLSASEILADLERRQQRIPVTARPRTLGYVGRRFLRRHWMLISLALFASLSLLVSLSQLYVYSGRAQYLAGQDAIHRACAMAREGSLQACLLAARAVESDPDDPGLRLQFNALLGTQWQFLYQQVGASTQTVVTPDGKWLIDINSGQNGQIRSFDNSNGQEYQQYRHGRLLGQCSLSGDGRWLACPGQDGRVVRWEVDGGKVTAVARHRSPALRALLDADGQHCLSAGQEGSVIYSSCRDGRVLYEGKHAARVTALAMSPDGEWGASASEAGEVHLFGLRTGREVWSLRRPSGVVGLAWSQGLVMGFQDGEILRYASGRTEAWPLQPGLEGLKEAGDGWVLSWGAGLCRVLGPSGLLQQFTQAGEFSAVALSADKKLLITGNRDGRADIWEVATGSPVYAPVSRPGRLHSLGFFADDGKVFTACSALDCWELEGVDRLPPVLKHPARVDELSWRNDGLFLACAVGNRVFRWDSRGKPKAQPLDTGFESFRVFYADSGALLCQDRVRDRLKLFPEPESALGMRELPVLRNSQPSANGAWACTAGLVLPLGGAGSEWALDNQGCRFCLPSDDGELVAQWRQDRSIELWGREGKVGKLPACSLLLLRFLAQGLLVVTEQEASLYDPGLRRLWTTSPARIPWTRALCDPAGRNLALVQLDRVDWIDLASGHGVRSLNPIGRLSGGTFLSDGQWLCLTGTQGAYLYGAQGSDTPLPWSETTTFSQAVCAPTGPQLALVLDRQVRLHSLPPFALEPTEKLWRRAEARTGRRLRGEVGSLLTPSHLILLRESLQGKPSP